MNELPRPVGSANYKRVESSLSNPLANAIKFHDCFHNASMTNLRDLKDPVRNILFSTICDRTLWTFKTFSSQQAAHLM